MRDSRHAREVERRFKEEIKKDKAKITVGRISRFGLLELSRQHLGLNIMRGSFGECPICHGVGLVRSTEALALSNLRKIWLDPHPQESSQVKATLNLDVANYLLNQKRNDLIQLEDRYKTSIVIEGSAAVLPHEGACRIHRRGEPLAARLTRSHSA